VPAGLLMAMCRSALRSVAPGCVSPCEVLAAVNRQLFPDIREDMFISMAYGILMKPPATVHRPRRTRPGFALSAGAPAMSNCSARPGLALGVDGGTVFERVTKDQDVELPPRRLRVVLYRWRARGGGFRREEFGMERMSESFRMAAPLGSEAILTRMQEELRQFTGDGPQMDDITLVAIEKKR
jgi:phosphoserine phosphatase RsbU/P